MLPLERTILKHLFTNREYAQTVFPHCRDEFFSCNQTASLYRHIREFFEQYQTLPTPRVIEIELEQDSSLSDRELAELRTALTEIVAEPTLSTDQQAWLLESTEAYCQERALYVALRKSVSLLDDPKHTPHIIPDMLREALAVGFTTSVGHDFFQDAEARYEFYHRAESRIPFDLDVFNTMTKNGLPKKTLNVVLAGCVHPDTPIRIMLTETCKPEIRPIRDIAALLADGYEVEVDGPDGFVPITAFVDKGEWDEYLLTTRTGQSVRCNEAHLFETPDGWKSARELSQLAHCRVLTHVGEETAIVQKTGQRVPIVDIQVDHPNHRYYTNGISSHNTNVGKSLFLVHMAAACLRMSKNVLYITLEMAEERIAERIDANMMNIPMDDIAAMSRPQYLRKIDAMRQSSTGRIIIKEYPTGAAHVGHFRALLQELRTKQAFQPDIIFIDYLSICASSRVKMGASINSYTYNKSIAEELRGFAVETDVPIFTASQFNRDGSVATDPGLDKIGESFAIAQTADFIIALTTSDELEKNGQLQCYTLKNRYGKRQSYQKFLLGVDTSRMKLYETANITTSTLSAPAYSSDEFASAFAPKLGARRTRRDFTDLNTE